MNNLNKNNLGQSLGSFFGLNKKTENNSKVNKIRFELDETEQKFQRIVETVNEGVLVLDKDRVITFVNEQLINILGYKENELLGHNVSEFIVSEELIEHERELQKRQKGKTGNYERRIYHKNGRVVWCYISASPLFNIQKKFDGSVALVTDITDRKKIENQLQMSEEKFSAAFNACPDLMSITSLHEGKILDVNESYTKLLGYTKAESVEKNTSELSIWAYSSDRDKFISALKKNRQVSDFESTLRRKDGTFVSVIDSAKVFKFQGVDCVLSVVHDISDRKKAELEREQFFNFFNLSSDIMVIADPNGAFKKVNPTCLNILGYSEKELISKPFVDFVFSEDKKSTIDEMARQIKIGSSINFENRYVCKNGKVLWLSWRANYNKKEGTTYATARDITDKKIQIKF